MAKRVVIFGGSGFLGQHVARLAMEDGWIVRIASRCPQTEGEMEAAVCDIREDTAVARALDGADAVVNCVGILAEHRANGFESIQAEGAGRIARLAAEAGIERMVHVSAIGADAASSSLYAWTKAAGEAGVFAYMPNALILRPSIIFGPEDSFFNRFAAMARIGPVLGLVGADAKFQPVFVDDVAQAVLMGIRGEAQGTYELGGPEVATMRALMGLMLAEIHRRRIILNMPFPIARLMATGFDVAAKASFGRMENKLLTRDQIKLLQNDNVVASRAKGFVDLGIEPTPMKDVLPGYLWRYRPGKQAQHSQL